MGPIIVVTFKPNRRNMALKLALSALLLASVSAAPSGPAPLGPIIPPVYNYNYAVKDDYSGSIFTAAEERDNYNAAGSYSVNLPDGRVQIVSYSVSGPDGGYIADVKYEGVASYAPVAAKPYKPAPVPVYKPAPKPVAIVPAYKPVAPKPVSPVYKPAPAPVYHRAPAYQAAAPSTRKYSYTVIAPEAPAALPAGAGRTAEVEEAARSARIEPDLVILNENSIEKEIILDAPVEVPAEEIIAVIEDAEIAFEEPAAPIVEAAAPIEEAIEEVIEVAAPVEAAAPIEEAAPVEEIPAEETIIEALETVEEEIAEIEAEEIGSTEETPAAAPIEEAAPAPAAPARFRFFRRFF